MNGWPSLAGKRREINVATAQNANLRNQLAQRAATSGQGAAKPIDRLKAILSAESVQQQFRNVLAENAGAFVASVIDLYNNDKYLQMCDPKAVVMEALKAASLKLPINKQLGFAWIVAYRDGKTGQYIPTFQLGYKGYIQLCLRAGAYRYINADAVYEGEMLEVDKLSGAFKIDPSKRISDKKVGYFAFIETLNGFQKGLYMTVEEITKHAQRFSKSYNSGSSTWKSDFDAMALKTCLRLLLSKYGVMSVEMQKAYIDDLGDSTLTEAPAEDGVIDAEPESVRDADEPHEADASRQAGAAHEGQPVQGTLPTNEEA
ncbi:MAG TPA: recombinase [Firmicutes bacterium]|nr:recombinase [Bacillota bacterium]